MKVTIDQTLLQAIEAHKAGRYQDAERLYRAILEAHPTHPDANHNLGVLAVGLGKAIQALPFLKLALEVQPSQGQFWISYINALIGAGLVTEAREVLQKGKDYGLSGDAVIQLERALSRAEGPDSFGKSRPSPNQINQLLESYNSGDFQRAEQLAIALTKNYPNHPFGWKALGAVLKSIGRIRESVDHVRRALLIDPTDAEAHSNLGNALNDLGQLEEAEASYREAVRIKPDLADAHSNLGNTLRALGRLREAEESCREAIRIKPSLAEAHGNLGNVLRDLGRLSDAEASYRKAIRTKPSMAEAHGNLGNLFRELGRLKEAEMSYREAIRIKPKYATVHLNLGNTLRDLSRSAEAERYYREAIRIKSDFAEAHNNLGSLLWEMGRLVEAEVRFREAVRLKPDYFIARNNLGVVLRDFGCLTDGEAAYREAIRLNPTYADAHSNLGNVLKDLGRQTEAEASYREAIRIRPELAAAHCNLGSVLLALGRLSESEVSYCEAIRLSPELTEGHNNLGNVYKDLGRLADAEASFRRAIVLNPDYLDARSNLLLSLAYGEETSREAALDEARAYGAYVSSKAEPKFSEWGCEFDCKKLRVGFVSGDLRGHSVGFFFEGVIKCLDKSRFEVFAFPTVPMTDDLTERIKSNFLEWIPLYGKSDLDAAKTIHDRCIHVLIDLSGHTAHNRLKVFSYKPAPVQVSWLGYCATTGLQEMDYVLGDANVTPVDQEWQFVESVWRLPESYICLTPPSTEVQVGELPCHRNGYITFGSFNNLSKMTNAVVSAWAEILLRVDNSKLFLKTKQLADTAAVNDTIDRFGRYGISADRLILEGPIPSRAAHLESYNRVDIALDTFPYNGVTTSLEALWMGVPVLTLKGDRFISNNGQSINTCAGQSDWIANGRDEYISKGALFASRPQALAQLRATLRDRVRETSLFDSQRFAVNFGGALWAMWKKRKSVK